MYLHRLIYQSNYNGAMCTVRRLKMDRFLMINNSNYKSFYVFSFHGLFDFVLTNLTVVFSLKFWLYGDFSCVLDTSKHRPILFTSRNTENMKLYNLKKPYYFYFHRGCQIFVYNKFLWRYTNKYSKLSNVCSSFAF